MNHTLLIAYAHAFTTSCQQANAVFNGLFVVAIILIALAAYHYYQAHNHHAQAKHIAEHGFIKINGRPMKVQPVQPAFRLSHSYRHIDFDLKPNGKARHYEHELFI